MTFPSSTGSTQPRWYSASHRAARLGVAETDASPRVDPQIHPTRLGWSVLRWRHRFMRGSAMTSGTGPSAANASPLRFHACSARNPTTTRPPSRSTLWGTTSRRFISLKTKLTHDPSPGSASVWNPGVARRPGRPCDTPAMADSLCAECSKPILSTDDKSTVQQVDACTRAVEYVTYHATCRDRKTGKEA